MTQPFARFRGLGFSAVLIAALSTFSGCDEPELGQAPPIGPSSDVIVEQPTRDRTFGDRQVEQILADRPDMRGMLEDDGPILAWVIDAFNGELTGQRIYWSADTPSSARPAEHSIPWEQYPGMIRISGGSETTPVDKWAGVVFELFNLQNTEGFNNLSALAIEGEIDAEQYADRCVHLEFEALERTAAFFADHPLPESPHGNDTFYNWITTDLGTFEAYRSAFEGDNHTAFTSNFEYFESYYHTALVPYRESLPQNAE